MKKTFLVRCVLTCSVLVCSTGAIHAVTLSSSPFSLGYGFTGFVPGVDPGSFNDSETSGANTPTTLGDFTFQPTVTSVSFSANGPVFSGRVLGDGVEGDSSAESAPFLASIAGSYTGAVPVGATDLQIQINIDSIRIWGKKHSAASLPGPTLAFEETTAGHEATSPTIDLVSTNVFTNAAQYTQLVWDPTDFATSGTSFTRTFELVHESTAAVDGFEIFGTIDFSYTPIPEPSSLFLAACAAIGLAGYRRWRSSQHER